MAPLVRNAAPPPPRINILEENRAQAAQIYFETPTGANLAELMRWHLRTLDRHDTHDAFKMFSQTLNGIYASRGFNELARDEEEGTDGAPDYGMPSADQSKKRKANTSLRRGEDAGTSSTRPTQGRISTILTPTNIKEGEFDHVVGEMVDRSLLPAGRLTNDGDDYSVAGITMSVAGAIHQVGLPNPDQISLLFALLSRLLDPRAIYQLRTVVHNYNLAKEYPKAANNSDSPCTRRAQRCPVPSVREALFGYTRISHWSFKATVDRIRQWDAEIQFFQNFHNAAQDLMEPPTRQLFLHHMEKELGIRVELSSSQIESSAWDARSAVQDLMVLMTLDLNVHNPEAVRNARSLKAYRAAKSSGRYHLMKGENLATLTGWAGSTGILGLLLGWSADSNLTTLQPEYLRCMIRGINNIAPQYAIAFQDLETLVIQPVLNNLPAGSIYGFQFDQSRDPNSLPRDATMMQILSRDGVVERPVLPRASRYYQHTLSDDDYVFSAPALSRTQHTVSNATGTAASTIAAGAASVSMNGGEADQDDEIVLNPDIDRYFAER